MRRPLRALCLLAAGMLLALWVFPLCSRIKNPEKSDPALDITPPVLNLISTFTDTVYLDSITFVGTGRDSSGLKSVTAYSRNDTVIAAIVDSAWEIQALRLTPGRDSIRLRLTDSLDNSTDSLIAVLYYEVAPAAPTNLVLEIYDRQNVRVRWTDNAQTEEGFNVWRSVNGLNWVIAGTAAANQIYYIDSTRLSPDTIYYYTVNAFNPGGISGRIPHLGITLPRITTVDTIAPVVRFVSPHDGDSLGTDSVLVLLAVSDTGGIASVRINDSSAVLLGNYWSRKKALTVGQNRIGVKATDRSGNSRRDSIFVYYGADVPDRLGPLVTFVSPQSNDTVSTANLMLSGTAIDPSGLGRVTVNDSNAAVLNDLNWLMPINLHNGTNRIRITATDRLNNPTDTVLVLVLDTNHVDNTSPVLQLRSPQPFDTIRTDTVTIWGAVFDPSGVCSVLVNSIPAQVEMLSWNATISLAKGWDTVTIEAFDSSALRNKTIQRILVLRNNPPVFLSTGLPHDTLLYRGDVYRADISALDPNDDPVTFSLLRPPSPAAAVLNGQTGRLEWTPAEKGEYPFSALVWDGNEADTAIWKVTVGANAPAFLPSLLASLPAQDTVGRKYLATLQAYDRDGPQGLIYRFIQGPQYVKLDSVSGQISWDIAFEDTGTHELRAMVRDPEGLSDTISWTVRIALGNIRSPQFTTALRSIPESDTVGKLYRVDLNATDPLPLILSYHLILKPNGMEIDSSGVITWTPVAADTGTRQVRAVVRNSQNRDDTLTWSITVYKNRLAPVFGAVSPLDTVLVGQIYAKLLSASHPYNEPVTYFFLQRPSPNVDLNAATGVVSWLPDVSYRDSVHALAAICTSSSGLSDTLYWRVFTPEKSPKMLTTAAGLSNSDTVGQTYTATLQARDPYPGTLVFRLVSKPSGMTIDSATGLVRWTPNAAQIGAHSLKAHVVNLSHGRKDSIAWTVTVYKNNLAPIFPAGGFVDTVLADSSYTRVISASHPYKGQPFMEPLVYVVRSAPGSASINALTGLLAWTPASGDTGLHAISVECTTAAGLRDTLNFSLFVPKRSPRFVTLGASLPQLDSVGGSPYIANLVAADDFPGDLTYTLRPPAPKGVTLTQTSRTTVQLTWLADSSSLGQHTIAVVVQNTHSRSDTISWSVIIYKDRRPPVFAAVSLNDTVIVDSSYAKSLSATHPYNDSIFYRLSQKPSSMSIHPITGQVTWYPGSADKGIAHAVTAICSIQIGMADTLAWSVFVADRSPRFTTAAGSLPSVDTAYGPSYVANLVAADDIPGNLTYTLAAPYPSGMVLNQVSRNTAQISWSSDSSHISGSPHTIKAVVANTHGRSDTLTWNITIHRDLRAPEFTTTDLADTSYAGDVYTKTLAVTHPYADRPYADTMTFALVDDTLSGNTVTKINNASAQVSWTPRWPHIRTNTIKVRVTTSAGLSDTMAWTVHVPNRAPVIGAVDTSSTYFKNHTWRGVANSWSIPASDPDAEPLAFTALAPTSGMGNPVFNNPLIGTLSWTLGNTDSLGYRTVKVQVLDQHDGADTLSWQVLCGDTALWNTGMVQIPAGSFVMGDTLTWSGEPGGPVGKFTVADSLDNLSLITSTQTFRNLQLSSLDIINDGLWRHYVTITGSAGNYAVNFFKDQARTQLVGHTLPYGTTGKKPIFGDGVPWSGDSVNIGAVTGTDNDIIINYRGYLYRDSSTFGGYAELPPHLVTLTRSYLMHSTEVTYRAFVQFMQPPGSAPVDSATPVVNVTQLDCMRYCNWLSKKMGLDTCYINACGGSADARCYATDLSKNGYRLPTEAEWEYAVRGTQSAAKRFPWGNSNDSMAVLRLYENFSSTLQPVMQRAPVSFGLYDMISNVSERCNDGYGPYSSGSQIDPTGPAPDLGFVVRGGYFGNTARGWRNFRSCFRGIANDGAAGPVVGFRIVRIPNDNE